MRPVTYAWRLDCWLRILCTSGVVRLVTYVIVAARLYCLDGCSLYARYACFRARAGGACARCPSLALKLRLTLVGKALSVKRYFNAPLRLSRISEGILLILRIRSTLPSFSGVGNASDLDESRGLLPLNLRPLAKRSAVGGKGVCAWTNPNPLGGGLACQLVSVHVLSLPETAQSPLTPL